MMLWCSGEEGPSSAPHLPRELTEVRGPGMASAKMPVGLLSPSGASVDGHTG